MLIICTFSMHFIVISTIFKALIVRLSVNFYFYKRILSFFPFRFFFFFHFFFSSNVYLHFYRLEIILTQFWNVMEDRFFETVIEVDFFFFSKLLESLFWKCSWRIFFIEKWFIFSFEFLKILFLDNFGYDCMFFFKYHLVFPPSC